MLSREYPALIDKLRSNAIQTIGLVTIHSSNSAKGQALRRLQFEVRPHASGYERAPLCLKTNISSSQRSQVCRQKPAYYPRSHALDYVLRERIGGGGFSESVGVLAALPGI